MVLGGQHIKTHTKHSIFKTTRQFVPAVEAEPEYSDDEKDAGVIIPQPKSDWLPGERLLKKINKQRAKDKKTHKGLSRKSRQKKGSRASVSQAHKAHNLSTTDVDQISASMSRLVAELT